MIGLLFGRFKRYETRCIRYGELSVAWIGNRLWKTIRSNDILIRLCVAFGQASCLLGNKTPSVRQFGEIFIGWIRCWRWCRCGANRRKIPPTHGQLNGIAAVAMANGTRSYFGCTRFLCVLEFLDHTSIPLDLCVANLHRCTRLCGRLFRFVHLRTARMHIDICIASLLAIECVRLDSDIFAVRLKATARCGQYLTRIGGCAGHLRT